MRYERLILPILAFGLYLSIYQGKVALFRQGHKVPVQVYAVSADIFPEENQQALRSGIFIKNQKHLARLLEAYLS